MSSRYKMFYEQVVRADMLSKMQYKNVHQIPTVKKIAVSGATHAVLGKGLDHPVASAFFLELITGQQAKFTRIRRGNARYKVREGFLEGSRVTLHGEQMWNFMDRLVTIVLPRITDFGGLKHSAFDGRGNYGIGIRDVNTFLEVRAHHACPQTPPTSRPRRDSAAPPPHPHPDFTLTLTWTPTPIPTG